MTRIIGTLTTLFLFVGALSISASVIFGGNVPGICVAPMQYSIGSFDERFGISEEEFRNVVLEAETLWEDALGRDLFVYNPSASFTINLVFDERQQQAFEEQVLRLRLDDAQERYESVLDQHEALVREYEKESALYESLLASYEGSLTSYNREVERWNTRGGAPEAVFVRLNDQQDALDVQFQELETQRIKTNQAAARANATGDRGAVLVSTYNAGVSTYNSRFGQSREFTQGDYQRGFINIYQFDDLLELRLVLAHELGHALGIDHVENESSLMYYLMGEQDLDNPVPTPEDIKGLERGCAVWIPNILSGLLK